MRASRSFLNTVFQYVGNTRNNQIKHYDYSRDYIVWSVEKALKDLQTDYLDLLLLHRPSPLMEANEIAAAISQLKEEGKTLNFGVSNFTASQVDLLHKQSTVSVNQIEFSLTQHLEMHNGSLDHMILNNIKPMSWSPLGSVFKEDNQTSLRIKAVLKELCKKYAATEDQILLACILKHSAGIHPVIGTTNKKRIQNAVKVADIALELQDWFGLLVAFQGHKVP